MTREEYEERQRALEEQHRADVAMLNAAHALRLRSLERLWQESVAGEEGSMAPSPASRPMRERYSVVNDLEEALPDLPEVFDRNDVIRALGYTPARTTLLRALEMLADDGLIAVKDQSGGGVSNRYRKLDDPDDGSDNT